MNNNAVVDYERLASICNAAVNEKYDKADIRKLQEVKHRLIKELDILRKNDDVYVLPRCYDLIHQNGLHPSQYNIRGTTAGMLVCYLLGLSHVDPLDSEVPLYSEFCTGMDGSRKISIDINVAESACLQGIKAVRQPEKAATPLLLVDFACTLNAGMYEATGYYPTDEDIRSDEILSLFNSTEIFGICAGENYGIESGLLGIPGISENYLKLVNKLCPRTIADLVKTETIFHGTGTWPDNGEKLIEDNHLTLQDLIGSGEDVYESMLSYGIEAEEAFQIAENVRRGRMKRGDAAPELKSSMIDHGIPDWFIRSCEQIRRMFPRAHCAEHVQMELRLLYYKLHFPEIYYEKYAEIDGV